MVTVKNNLCDNIVYPFDVIRINALHIKAKNYFKHLRFASIFLSNYIQLKEIAKGKNVDAVLLINHYLDIAFPAIYAAKSLKLPLVISVGTQMQSLNPMRNKILRFLDRLICGRLIFPFCNNIVSWDSEIERYIKEVQRKKIANKSVIIPFGPNGNTKELLAYKKEYILRKVILGVGAIISQRDYLFHIKVLKELLDTFPDIKLKIIGHIYDDAPVKLAKKLGVSGNVEFIGEVSHERVISEMKNADIHWMMLSGQYVGLGTATLEAMLLGVPSVSNAPENLFGEAKLNDMQNYIFTDGNNVKLTTQKLIHLFNNEHLRVEIGQNGKSFVKKYLNWDYVAEKYIELFNKIINEKK